MSQQDNSQNPANQGPGQPVDIDELEVDILIICKSPAGFQQSASFLSRRGMPTTVMGNLGKAIDYMIKKDPDFVLISCNHPNPGTVKLPSLMGKSNLNCIAFTETGDTASTAKLSTLPFKHKLQGLPSGPNIQRMIRKILMEMYNPQAAAKERESLESKKGLDQTLISGGKGQSDLTSIRGEEEDSLDAGSYRLGRKGRKKLKDLQHSATAENEERSPENKFNKTALLELARENEARSRGESGMIFMPTRNDPTSMQATQEARETQSMSAVQEAFEPQSMSAVQEALEPQSMNAVQEGLRSTEHKAIQNSEARATPDLPSRSGSGVDTFKSFKSEKTDVKNARYLELFEKSIRIALERTCEQGSTKTELTTTETVGILPVDSVDLHGYLVICISAVNAQEHMGFLPKFRQVLTAMLLDLGASMLVEEGFVIQQESFEYLQWAQQEASFCLMAEHKGHRLGVSFLPTENRFGDRPRASGKADMALVSVKDIDTEKPVPFKAYLHLQRNDRFYLYLRNGRKLITEQKNRLLTREVADFYIKSVDVKNYQTYAAANYVSRSLRRAKLGRTG